MASGIPRRSFLGAIGAVAGAAILSDCHGRLSALAAEAAPGSMHLSCNQYTWTTFYQRDGKNFGELLDAGLADVKSSGYDGFEPGIGGPADVERFAPLLKKAGLQMRSLYINSSLHEHSEAEKSIANIVATAEKAKGIGCHIVVTNPNPIRWGGAEDKSDAQLKVQAAAMDKLGEQLHEMGMKLAYHNHDIELRSAAREFHHMMVGTDPKHVSLCLDAHWVYRGCGNSAVALFDIVKLYGARVCELHLRQSTGNVWSETFGEGDIDYALFAKNLADLGVKPLLVMEQAPEGGTAKTLDAVGALSRSAQSARMLLNKMVE